MKFSPSRRSRRVFAGLLLFGALLYPGGGSAAVTVDVKQTHTDPGINEFLSAGHNGWTVWTANSTMDNANWERTNVYLRPPPIGGQWKVNPSGTWAQAGGFNGSTLLFSAWTPRTDADIYKYNINTRDRSKFGRAVNSRYDDYRPTMSGDWLLFTRYNWDDHIHKVMLFNRSTGALQTLATSGPRSFVGAGQVNGDWAVYEVARSTGSKVFRYNLSTGDTVQLPNGGRAHAYSPSVADDGTAFYVRSGNGCGTNVDIVRSVVDGATEKVSDLADNQDIGNMYVEALKDGGRDVHLTRIQCNRAQNQWLNTYRFSDIYEFAVEKAGTGTGTVASSPSGINCGITCTDVVPYGYPVTLTATPDPGSLIAGWSIPECGTESQCVVNVDGNETVTVTFGSTP